jgi:hypothetical protein
MRSELYIDSGDAQKNLELFRALQAERAAIEAAYGEPLHWEELPTKQACRLTDYAEGDVSNLDQHDSYIDWFFDASQRLRDAIGAAGVATLRIQ